MRLFVSLLLSAALLIAQEPDSPTFRTSTRLVQVDVVVKSKDVPVGGLTQDDFKISDNGKRQQIAVFSVRDATVAPATPVPLPPGVVTNRPAYRGPEPVSATVLLIDAQNSYPEDQQFFVQQALQYLERASRRELVAVYALGGSVTVLQEFTEDREALSRSIRKYNATQSLNMQDGQYGLLAGLTDNSANATRGMNLQRQADIMAACFEALARHLKGLPGRKKVIWISSGLPLTLTQEYTRNGVVMREFTNLSDQILAPIKSLNDANVAIYPVDLRGGKMCLPDPATMKLPPCLADPNITTLMRFADRTGGRAFYLDNRPSEAIEEAFADTDLTYTLGFYPTEERLDGRQHSISVKVNRKGANLRYRQSYTSETASIPPTEKLRKETLNAWVHQPLNATEIPIQAAAVPSVSKPGLYDVEIGIDASALQLEQKDGRYIGNVELAIVPDLGIKPKGLHQTIKVNLTPERLLKALDTGIVVVNQISVPQAKKLHAVVMDQATGKTGSVWIPLN